MRMFYENVSRKVNLKKYFSILLSVIFAIEMIIPGGMVTYAADTGTGDTSLTAATGSAIYVDGTNGNDSNSGTSASTAFKTIEAGVTALQNGGTLHIATGSYNEPMLITNKSDITVVGEKDAIITGTSDAVWEGYAGVLSLSYCTNVDVSNINFKLSTGDGNDSTVIINHTTGANIHNCKIEAGSGVGACVQPDSNSSYYFDSNILSGASTRGFWFIWGVTKPCSLTNNIIKNTTSIDFTPYEASTHYEAPVIIENNTCLGAFEATALGYNTYAYTSPDMKNIVANNIFSKINVTTDTSSDKYSGKHSIMDANYEYNSIADCGFTNEAAGDYSITATSPCNDTGSKTYEAATDFLGAPRTASTADKGAFQVTLPDTSIYVDGTKGSDTNTGLSADKALKTIKAAMLIIKPGSTLYIASGTYNESMVLQNKSNIRIVGVGDVKVTGSEHIIWTSYGIDYPGVLNIDKSSNIDISKIDFIYAEDKENAKYDSTVFVVDSTNVNVHNCIIEAGETVTSCVQTNANGQTTYTFDSNILKGKSSCGFWIPWGVEAQGCQISNNIIQNTISIDVRPYSSSYKYSEGILIANNTCLGDYEGSTLPDDKNTVVNNIFANINTPKQNSGVKKNNYDFATVNDVKFVNAAGGDYHITAESPCNDAGSKQYEMKYDILGAERKGVKSDIGAYQYGNVYYATSGGVTGADGSLNKPFAFTDALTTLQPGDTLYMEKGDYVGVYDLSAYSNLAGISTAYIYIAGQSGAVMWGTTDKNAAFIAKTNNQYLDISGLTLQMDSTYYHKATIAELDGVSNFNIHDCSVINGANSIKMNGDSSNCEIYNNSFYDNSKDISLNNCNLKDSKIYNNLFGSKEDAIIYADGGSISNTIIINNVFSGGCPVTGLHNNTSVTKNIIENNIFTTDKNILSSEFYTAANSNVVDYNYFATIPSGAGDHNVTGDPYLDGSYHITDASSVLFNAGDDIIAPDFDRAGNARVGRSDIGMYEAVGLDVPEVIPDWGKKMTHPALLKSSDIESAVTDIKNGVETDDADQTNLGTSLENVWSNVIKATEEYVKSDYFVDTRNHRFCLYYPYMLQPVSWASTSSMQVGDLTTANSNAKRAVAGITQSTYYVNFDFKPVSPASAKDYIIYGSTAGTDFTDVMLKMSDSKLYISNGSDFVTVKNSAGADVTLEDGTWYNVYITVNKAGSSSIIIHPRGTTTDFRANFQTFGSGAIDGMFIGCQGSAQGKAHFDNIRIYDTYVPVVDEGFSTLDSWTKSGTVLASNEAAYPSSKGSYNWTSINGDIQTILQNLAITYTVKKSVGDADANTYFVKAKQLMLSIAHWKKWGDPDEPEKGSLDIGYIATGMSYAYDLLYNDLTADERALIAKAIKTKAVDVLMDANTDASEYGYYDGVSTAPNTMYVQNAALGLAALVVGDVYNTEKALTVARDNLNDSYAHGVDKDGAWIEGFIYGDLAVVNAIPFHDADNRITGDTAINNEYFNKVVDYVIYNMFPGGKLYSNVADSSVSSSYQYKKVLEYYTKNSKNKYAAWALKRLGTLPSSMDLLSLVWFPSGVTVTEPTESEVALGKVFNDIGVATLKTGWDTDDSLVTLKSSKIVANMQHHTHLDQNSIELMRGTSYLLCDPGYQSWSGSSRNFNYGTLGHNTLVLDGSNQNGFNDANSWTEMFGAQLENYFIGDKYGYSVGSAGLAYYDQNNGINTVPEWRRSIVDLLDNDYYVLFDDYQTNSDGKNLVWQLLSKGEWSANADNNAMQVTIGNDQLSVIFLNTDFSSVKVDNAYGTAYGYSDTHRIYTKLNNGKENQNLLALLYPSAKGAQLPATTYISDSDDTGVVVKSGSSTDVVLFHKDSDEPVVLSGATHVASLGSVAVDSSRVNKIVVKYKAEKDVNLLQGDKIIGTLVGDGTERVDSFVLNSASGSVTLSASGSVEVSDVWSAATIKTDVVADTSDVLTLPNPDSYYDLEISYTGATNAVVSQDGVVIGKLADGSGKATIELQKPYTEKMTNNVRTATADIDITGVGSYTIKVAENETRHRIGTVLDVGDATGKCTIDKEYNAYNTPGMSVVGNAWSDVQKDGALTYRTGSANAQLYVNSPNARNSYTVYIKYKATKNVPVYQYKSSDTKTQIAELSSSSSWKVASFNLKEYTYSAQTIDKDLVKRMLLQFGEAIEVESSWIELRASDNQVDYTDVGKTGDNSFAKHNPGLVIGENFADADNDARVSESNGTIYATIPDTGDDYYVNIQFKSTAGGKITQVLDKEGTTKEIAQYNKSTDTYTVRFKLNGHYYDSNADKSGTNVLLKLSGDITISDMWMEEQLRTSYDTDLDEVDCTGSGSGSSFEPVKLTAYMPESNMDIDGVLSEDWNLNLDLSYGTSEDSDFTAKAGVKWDTNYCYIAAKVTDPTDYDGGDVNNTDAILGGDGLEVYIAKTRGQKQYDLNTAQYVFSTLNGIFVGGGNGQTDLSKVVKDGITYVVKRNDTGYVMEIAIPWQSIGGMSVQAGDKIGFTLHAFDKDAPTVGQSTIGLTEQYMEGDWYKPFYWPELSLVNQNLVPAESISLNEEKVTLDFAETFDLKSFVEPISANEPISYTSSDENVAKVDKWGSVTGLSAGTATITATTGKVTAQCVVTVNAATDKQTISMKNTKYALGDSVDVFYTGSSNPQWIGIYPASVDTPNNSYLGWSYVSSTVKSGCVSITPFTEKVPATTGKFKVFLFKDGGYTPVEGQSIEFEVINPIGISGVTISKSSLDIKVGDKGSLTASVNEDTTNDKHIVWSSSNTKVAAVDQNGRILGIGAGTAVITATAYGDNSKKATCTVTVSAKPADTTPGSNPVTPTPTPTVTPTPTPTVTPTPTPIVKTSTTTKTGKNGSVTTTTKSVITNADGSKTTVSAQVVEDKKGKQTSATASVSASPAVATSGKDVTFALTMPEDQLLETAKGLDDGTTLYVTYKLQQSDIVSNIKKGNNYDIVITQPASISDNSNIDIKGVVIPKAVLQTVRSQGVDLTVTVQDENQKPAYTWTFDGSALKDSKTKITDVNLVVDVNTAKDDTDLSAVLKKDTKNSKGIVADLSASNLPKGTSLKLNVTENGTLGNATEVYVYALDRKTNKLVQLKTVKYKVDKDGCISLDAANGVDYVILKNKPSSNVVTKN